jgi:hypothetical protein
MNNISGFFEGLGSPEVRASNLANDSGVIVVGGGRPVIFARRERMRRISGIERTMDPIVDRKLPKCSMRDMIAKKEECVAVNVDSIIPANDKQLSTTERTKANAAKRLG